MRARTSSASVPGPRRRRCRCCKSRDAGSAALPAAATCGRFRAAQARPRMSEGAGDATPFVESALAVALGGVICTEAVVVSVALIVRHLQKLSRPDLQYPIARMVMLVPVYSIASQIALTSGLVAAQAAATIRDVYEVRPPPEAARLRGPPLRLRAASRVPAPRAQPLPPCLPRLPPRVSARQGRSGGRARCRVCARRPRLKPPFGCRQTSIPAPRHWSARARHPRCAARRRTPCTSSSCWWWITRAARLLWSANGAAAPRARWDMSGL